MDFPAWYNWDPFIWKELLRIGTICVSLILIKIFER